MTDAVLLAMIVSPLLITFLLKSDAALSFLVLCLGFVLSTSVIGDLKHLLSQTNLSVTESTLGLILILTPFLLTMLITRKSAGKGFKFALHLITAASAGCLLALSLGPVINTSTLINLFDSQVWRQLDNFQSIIIGVGAITSLMLVWTKALKKSSKKKH